MNKLDSEISSEKPRKTIIYFVRHGESIGNTKKTHVAPEEDFLAELGKTQAKLVGQFLRDEDFSAVFSSPYPRALETAQIILACNSSKNPVLINTEPRLVERDFGLLPGERIEGRTKQFSESKTLLVLWDPEGAETAEQVNSRIYSFLQDLFKIIDSAEESHEKMLVVSHASVFLYLSKILATDSEKFRVKGEKLDYVKIIPNTSFLKVAVHAQDPNSNSNTEKARTIEILTARGTDHLKQENRDGSQDVNSSSSSTPNKFSQTILFNELATANSSS